MGNFFHALKNNVLNNKGAKLVAVILALATWYAIQAAIRFETMVTDIPVNLQIREGWAVLDRSARTVDVLFRGSREDIRFLSRDQITVDIDLRNQPFAESSVIEVNPNRVRALGAARAVMVRPSEITLKLDHEAEKMVPVKADLQGVLPEGYEVEKMVCTPASVKLFGPNRRLKDIESLRTMPIDLEGRVQSFKKLRVPILPPSESWVARLEPENIMVEVEIVERSATKEISDMLLGILVNPGLASKTEVRPSKVDVTLRGQSDLLNSQSRENVRAYVDCTGLELGAQYELPVRISAAPGVQVGAVKPPNVKVTVGQ